MDEDEHDDDVTWFYNEVNQVKTSKELFTVLTENMCGIDPIILVRENNPLLVFLKDIRGF